MAPLLKSLAAAAAVLGVVLPIYGQGLPPSPTPAACPLQPAYPLPESRAELKALAGQLEDLSSQPGCLADAFFHAWRGAVLLAAGEPAAAIEPLERALLTRPDLPAAELDLALAFAATGDALSASALIDGLEQRTDLPAPLRAALEQRRALLAQVAPSARWYNRVQITATGGWDTNLNNAPSATELTLTLPQGNVTLPLAATALARSGGAGIASVQWQGLRPSGASLWVLQSELRVRKTGEPDTDYQQADVAASWLQAPEAPSQWVGRLGASYLRFGGLSLLGSQRAAVQYQWQRLAPASTGAGSLLAQCRPAASLEVERRRYPATRQLDGSFQAVSGALICVSGQEGATSLFNLQLRTGRDHPDDDSRPGGTQTRHELRAQWEAPLPSPLPGLLGPGRIGLQWASAWQADTTGYSALLENNAVRRITRHAVQAEASFALGGGLSVIANSEISQQKSNLPAFAARQRSFYLGLRWELM